MTTYDLPIDGMTCASCAARVERALSKQPGVTQASVNLAREQVRVESTQATLEQLVGAIEQAGYQVPMSTLELAIGDMTCASCAGRVERALSKVSGVTQVSVNLADETARLRVLSGFDAQQAIVAVHKAGYDAQIRGKKTAAAEDTSHRLRRERGQVIAALVLSAPLVLPMLLMPFGVHWMPSAWVQFVLASIVQFGFGARFYRAAWRALRSGAGNMDQLVALGTSAGFGLSLYHWVTTPTGASPHLYFEASAVIISLILLGKYLESRAKRQTASAIAALQALRPDKALRIRDGREESVSVEALQVGDLLLIKPGERFPVDGQIIDGHSHADESLISGESLPVTKAPGDSVTAGAINAEGQLRVQTTAVGADTVLSRIIRLVEDAQAAKAPIQKLVDRVSQVFVPAVLVIALATLLVWLWLGAGMEQALLNAVAVLVIACPCALGLATPTAIMAGTGVAARHGILIKDAQVLELAPRITQVAFDKTGTLTEGRPRLLDLQAIDDDNNALLRLAGALQQGSEHPLTHAVLQACDERQIELPALSNSRALTGKGIEGVVEQRALQLGNPRLLTEQGLDGGALATTAQAWEAQGRTLSWLIETAPQPRVLGLLAFGDALKDGAVQAVQQLHAEHIHTHLISGDNAGAVNAAASTLGIDQPHANVLPGDKAARINALRQHGAVAMVGDGINDAPALAAADIGIAMGNGTDAAMHAAGITLMRGDPRLVPAALEIGRRTYGKIRQNLFWAFIYNLIGIPLAAAGLLNPMFAGAAMALSSVSVVSNALLLSRWKPRL